MIATDIPLAILGLAFLVALARAATGPSLADRVVASEVALVSFVGGIGLLAVRLGSTHFLDAVVLAALLQFVATIALSRLLERKERE